MVRRLHLVGTRRSFHLILTTLWPKLDRSFGSQRLTSVYISFFRKQGGAVGALATHIDDILGRGEQDLLSQTRAFSGHRSGKLKVQEPTSVRAGMEVSQETNFTEKLAQEEFTSNLKPPPTYPDLQAAPRQPLSQLDIQLRRCTFGELRWPAPVSRPDICARVARIAPRVDPLQGSDFYRFYV